MADFDGQSGSQLPEQGLVALTHAIYALHALTVIAGLMTSALIVTAFLTGWPSILAVILNYLKASEARGTYLESHFRWQIRTFWFALLWVAVAGLLAVTIVGLPLAWAVAAIAGLWVLYRVTRGWLRLSGA
ncbi:MAG: hypothetical protein COZ38_06410, partial [Rhodocyclales bacterium CG_4_10_14_3_um_filter_68_10]